MAINLNDEYPNGTNAPSAAYPFGSAKNESSPGALDGMPWAAPGINDWAGFFQALLSGAGLTPSGVPDEVGASQYLEALLSVLSVRSEVVELGGDFDAGAEMRYARVGQTVTLSITSANLMHASSDSAASAEVIPAALRPSQPVQVLVSADAGGVCRLNVTPGGEVQLTYRDWSGAFRSETFAPSFTVSYAVA